MSVPPLKKPNSLAALFIACLKIITSTPPTIDKRSIPPR
jgi:hypothetical protein